MPHHDRIALLDVMILSLLIILSANSNNSHGLFKLFMQGYFWIFQFLNVKASLPEEVLNDL